jgi:hypothetical protein
MKNLESPMSKTVTTVSVTIIDREDQGLRVYSDDLPGLILSGPNKHEVMARIVPAICALFKAAKKLNVKVTPAKSLVDILEQPSPRTISMRVHEQTQVYVVELLAA